MFQSCCAKTCALLLCPPVVVLLLIYLVLAYVLSVLLTLLYIPRLFAVQKLYWCCPFIPHIWEAQTWFKGQCMRVGFESTYTINVLRRMLTLPIRPHLPDFYIVGFPKAGTTSLANHLKQHPALSGLDGLPWHESLSKESHFFNGVLGRSHASSALLYRSFFPTILCRWWSEYIRGVEKWMCFDACPVTACLPYTARRMKAITPDAKLIFMMRDPVPVMFSAETMLVNMGVPLTWSLVDPMATHDPRFQESEEEAQLWKDLKDLQPSDPLPHNMPDLFYSHLHSLLMCGQYADRIHPFLQEFPRANAYSQKASQASASLLNTSARHQLPFAHASATARHGTPSTRAALPRHTDISSAMEGVCLPGPAGALQRAQAAGLQMPHLADLDLQSQSAQTASQQQLHQQMHPDFVSPAWHSAMEALDLLCFSETSPLLQNHVKKVKLCQSSCKLPKMILLVESLKYTGCGDAFAQLKDPSGSIGAGIHAQVLQAEEGLSPGAVLMLQQVPLLVLSKTIKYLCITVENIVQVINCD